MKNKLIILTAIILLALGNSCTDWLDIRPESEIVLDDYWQNESQVNQVLAACYRSLAEDGAMKHMLVWGELRSDNVTFGKGMPSDMNQILNFDISPSNYYCKWNDLYTTINYCNTLLYYAPQVVTSDANFTEAKLHSVEAEALAIRALAYFYLVRAFKEVPWVDQPSINDVQDYNIPKSEEDLILGKLIEDLTTAIRYGRDEFETVENTKGRFTKNGMRALLADIHLWRGEYSECIRYCDQILADPKLVLVDDEDVVTEVFSNGNSSESIFELQFDQELLPNYVLRDFYGYFGEMQGYWSFPDILVTGIYRPFRFRVSSGYESRKDIRLKDFLFQDSGGDKYYVFKYAGYKRIEDINENSTYYYRNSTPNWIFYRLPDIILMKSEALVELDDFEGAIDLISQTYLRSNPEDEPLKLSNYTSKFEMEKLVLRERQRELMFEGKRWFDLLRFTRRSESPSLLLSYVTKKISGSSSLEISKMSVMESLYMPIATSELEANSALVQNPFYETTGEN